MPIEPTLEVEQLLFDTGATAVIGCDEVGRGAIAGPVYVGMGMISSPKSEFPIGVRDSKLLSPKRRAALVEPISGWLDAFGVGGCDANQIDDIGIVRALGVAGAAAYLELEVAEPNSTVLILDGTFDWITPGLIAAGVSQLPVVRTRAKADRDCAVVACASVLAKERRDGLMIELSVQFPAYGWDHNKGYGAKTHMQAVLDNGPTELHRLSWLHLDRRSK